MTLLPWGRQPKHAAGRQLAAVSEIRSCPCLCANCSGCTGYDPGARAATVAYKPVAGSPPWDPAPGPFEDAADYFGAVLGVTWRRAHDLLPAAKRPEVELSHEPAPAAVLEAAAELDPGDEHQAAEPAAAAAPDPGPDAEWARWVAAARGHTEEEAAPDVRQRDPERHSDHSDPDLPLPQRPLCSRPEHMG